MTPRKPSFSGKIETETALIIKDRALQNAQRIANLSKILDYDLIHRRSFTVRDSYFDTASHKFTRNRVSFRVRRYSRDVILSVKSSPRKLLGGGTSRLEIERPWSYRSLARTASKLRLDPPSQKLFDRLAGTPSRVLAAAGLEIIQTRLTRRKSRDLVVHGTDDPHPFAELSIDEVTYSFTKGQVRFLEIEIEAKAERALQKIKSVVNYLLDEYPSLQVWIHGKFVTGLAINKLLVNRNLNDLTRERLLTADGLRLVDQTIRAGPL